MATFKSIAAHRDHLFEDAIFNSFEFQKHIRTLTPSQQRFVSVLQQWFEKPRNLFVLVSGGPGSGKTHTVVKTLRWFRSHIIFMAPTARLAKKIGGQTIHSRMRLNWKSGSVLRTLEEKLTHTDDIEFCIRESGALTRAMTLHDACTVEIVVIDEVGMIPFWLLYRIVEKFFKLKRKRNSDPERAVMIVCMGDSCQLKPVTSEYNVFQVPFDAYFETIRIEMQESKRFTPEYKVLIDKLRSLMSEVDYSSNNNNNNNDDNSNYNSNYNESSERVFRFVRETFPIVENLDETVILKANRILAYKNLTVQTCNDVYLHKMIKDSKLYKLYEVRDGVVNRDNPLCLKRGCAVILTENGYCVESNGACLTFLHYDDQKDGVVCSGGDGEVNNWKKIVVYRNPYTGRFPLTLGFALTVHKFQGETIDETNIVFCFDKCKDLHLVYTALSRVRSIEQILAVIL